jgi:hypothetical protein
MFLLRKHHEFVLVIAVLVACTLSGACTAWHTTSLQPQRFSAEKSPEQVRLTLNDGLELTARHPVMVGSIDSFQANTLFPHGVPAPIAISQMARLEIGQGTKSHAGAGALAGNLGGGILGVVSLDSPRPRFHGIALKPHFQLTSAWSYSYVDGVPPQTFVSNVEGGLGLGLQLSYAITPNLAPYFGVDVGSELTTESAQSWVAYGMGLELRFPVSRHVLPYGSVGATRWVHRDGLDFSYTLATFGGGLEVFLSRRLALHYGLRFSTPVSGGKDYWGRQATVDATQRFHLFGLSWYVGRRGP